MAIGNFQGRARTSRTSPRAKGACDTCGFWYQHHSLRPQMQWAGPRMIDTGYLVCQRCLDVPQEQYRTLILPADPAPVVNPRYSQDGVNSQSGGSNNRISSTGPISSTTNLISGT